MAKRLYLPSDTNDPIVLADWLELVALTASDHNSSQADLERELNRLGVEGADSICSEAMTELEMRISAAGQGYPFTFSGTLLELRGKWQSYTPYVFCLLLSFCDDAQRKVTNVQHEVLFEKLCCIAAKEYIGGDVRRFGHPRDGVEMPAGFVEALKGLCREVCEWSCSHVGRTHSAKDGGLDLVAWKPFPDRRIGKLILFGHCASGANWQDKIGELDPNAFCTQWLGGDRSPIVKSFFIPHLLRVDDFEKHALRAHLFFDRCRIAYLVGNAELPKDTGRDTVRWCENLLKRIGT